MPPDTAGLSASLRKKVLKLAASLERGPAQRDLTDVLDELSRVSAASVSRAASELSRMPGLGWWHPRRPWWTRLRRNWSPADLIRASPQYAWLFVFHADGRVRERALASLASAPDSPFFFAAIALRLNDWAEPVRLAAMAAASRLFPATSASTIATAAAELLPRLWTWRRWKAEGQVLASAFGRSDVIAALAAQLRSAGAGPLAATLRSALQYPEIDRHLPDLAAGAVSPALRAVALQALLRGEAAWPTGHAWHWMDKAAGHGRWTVRHETRPLTARPSTAEVIRMGLADKSSLVRRLAASALVEARSEVPDADELIASMQLDRSGAVRLRADYMLRHPS